MKHNRSTPGTQRIEMNCTVCWAEMKFIKNFVNSIQFMN